MGAVALDQYGNIAAVGGYKQVAPMGPMGLNAKAQKRLIISLTKRIMELETCRFQKNCIYIQHSRIHSRR